MNVDIIGQPLSRSEGRLKVTGRLQYTGDIPVEGLVHGVIVHSTVARGRTVSIDTTPAQRAPGVIKVFTHENFPRMNPAPAPWSHLHPTGQSYFPLQDDEVHYAGQPIALVIAETRDQAMHAGTLIGVEYETEKPHIFDEATARDAVDPPQFLWPVTWSTGDPDSAIANAPVKIEQTYTTADRHHNQMEPHVTTAVWDGEGNLTLHDTTQHIFGARELVSIVLGVPSEKITVRSDYLGGGFGGKAYVWPHTLLAALAAKAIGNPVRVQLTRAQMYSMVGHQPQSIQTFKVGANLDGTLTGIHHESITPTSPYDQYIEYAALVSRSLWGTSGGIHTHHKILPVNRNTPTALRSPHEALGHFAVESAMDELAYELGVDPVELRLRNEAATLVEPQSGRPFSTRAVREALEQGAERFGWADRTPEPRSMRDGRYLIGQGVACAIYTHWKWPASARVTLNDDGTALVETGSHELGTGTYTVMRQLAADALGLAPENVTVRLGDTRLPVSHASIGSATMANAGSSVLLAAEVTRQKAVQLALNGRDPVFSGAAANDIVVVGGTLRQPGNPTTITYAELLERNGLTRLIGDGDYNPIEEHLGPKAVFSFSAVFAEVRVDPDLGTVRLNRYVGAYDAGRIINPKTARSQAIGGIIWGTGQALLEKSETDPELGRFVNRNYSGYLVPTNADIPRLDVLFVGDHDAEASAVGAKGLGELTAVSVAPAIANAVYHATGKRVRHLPITVEDLL
ncbi:xanthine dehydrogenase family protein molybdopterin-binding subunit [Amycolatopsis sp. NPDC051903]|uniref:xanthine dehydrogenase family protein molybdopterin-binding subunit n=1 Tax=Amycolatopsis sp. NPDC051903 TaxID=3363936 RepID=UPI00378D85C1